MKIKSISLLFGIILSLALFWLMQAMISNNQQGFNKTDSLHMTEFVRLKKDTKMKVKDRHFPDEPPPPEKRPPPPQMQMQQVHVAQTNVPKLDMPNLDIPLQTERFSGSLLQGVQIGKGDIRTKATPLVRIDPHYSRRLRRKNIEGRVQVRFTITEQGTVKDLVIVEEEPPGVFNSAVLKAVKQWKYKPKIIGGVAVEQYSEMVFHFNKPK